MACASDGGSNLEEIDYDYDQREEERRRAGGVWGCLGCTKDVGQILS